MSRLVVNGSARVDTWAHLADDESPGGGDFTVGIARWLEQRTGILACVEGTGRSLGVRLTTNTDPADLAHDIRHFALVVIEIPDAADGRFFSIAARLREHLRYRGELRVTGEVAPDQLSFMQRCGIDAFELEDGVDVEGFIRRYQRFYQSGSALTTRDNLIRPARRRVARSPRRSGSADHASQPAPVRPVAFFER